MLLPEGSRESGPKLGTIGTCILYNPRSWLSTCAGNRLIFTMQRFMPPAAVITCQLGAQEGLAIYSQEERIRLGTLLSKIFAQTLDKSL